MYQYKCKKCHLQFENSLSQSRCNNLKCQSKQIKDMSVPVSMGQEVLLMGLEPAGQKNMEEQDRNGLQIRIDLTKLIMEEEREWQQKD